MIAPGRVIPAALSLAMPKSRILTVPSGPTIRFAGLMSRWTMPASCACARPAQTSSVSCSLRSDGERRPQAHEIGEGFAPHVLHRDERQAVVFADVVDGDDVGMTQAAGRGGFAGETIAKLRRVVAGPEQLDGDVTADARIARAIERTHPALTDQVDDLVAPEGSWNLHRSAELEGVSARSAWSP